jgi:hypothetical protein
MGNPFLFADRFSGAVVHLTTGGALSLAAAFTASFTASFTA